MNLRVKKFLLMILYYPLQLAIHICLAPLIICIIILLVLDIALAVGIYSCGASYDAQATSNTAQTTQASQTGQTTAQSNHT